MPIVGCTFGSFGGIITLIELANTVKVSLSEARGSAAHCRNLVTYLDDFSRSLGVVKGRLEPFAENSGVSFSATAMLHPDEMEVILNHIASCYRLLGDFNESLAPYVAITDAGPAKSFLKKLRRLWRKIRFIAMKSEAADLERRLTSLTVSITLVLQASSL